MTFQVCLLKISKNISVTHIGSRILIEKRFLDYDLAEMNFQDINSICDHSENTSYMVFFLKDCMLNQ